MGLEEPDGIDFVGNSQMDSTGLHHTILAASSELIKRAVLPTRLIALSHAELSADELCTRLRSSDPPVIARVEEGRVLVDLRTVFAEQDAQIAATLNALL